MKLHNGIIDILKNFKNINSSLVVKKGNELRTISLPGTFFAKAEVDVEFPNDFAIFDLGKFISVLSLFETPNLVFEEKRVIIESGNKKSYYTISDETVVNVPLPQKNYKLPSVDCSFTMTKQNLKDIERGIAATSVSDFVIIGDGSKIYLEGRNTKDPTSDRFSIEVGETDADFEMVFDQSNIRFMPFDYDVELSTKGIAKFSNEKIEYWVVAMAKTK